MADDPTRLIYMPQAKHALPFTGERLTTDVAGDIQFEHWHRYMYAEEFCRGRDVLDVASGEGYGSALISQVAKSVVGVDVDPDAISHAKASYAGANLSFIAGSATQIPCSNRSFDVVLSFETLEHLQDHDQFLFEIKRVLRSDGVLIISSPNVAVYSAPFEPINTHHKRELFSVELADLIGRNFSSHRALGQMNLWGNALIPLEEHFSGSLLFNQHVDNRFGVYENNCRSKFQLIIASDSPLRALKLSMLNAVHHHAIQSTALDQLTSESARLTKEISELRADLEMERERSRASLEALGSSLKTIQLLAGKSEVKAKRSQKTAKAAPNIRAGSRQCL